MDLEGAGRVPLGLALDLGDPRPRAHQDLKEPLEGGAIVVAQGFIGPGAVADRTTGDVQSVGSAGAVSEESVSGEGPGVAGDGLEQQPSGQGRGQDLE